MAVLHPIRVFSMTGQVVPFPPLIAFLYLSLEGPKLCIADARELFCSDGRASIGAGFRGGVVTEGGNVRVRSIPAICRRGHALGRAVQNRGREAASDRAAVHMDGSSGSG